MTAGLCFAAGMTTRSSEESSLANKTVCSYLNALRRIRKLNWRVRIKNENEFDDIDRYLNEIPQGDFRNKILYVYMRTYMMDQVMVKVDRAGMANALETRAPFLDTSLVEFANSLPYSYKYRNFTTKYILKKLMKDKLPKDIVYRRKKGFGIPLGKWLKGDLKDWCNEILSEKNTKKIGLFEYSYIDIIKDEHFSGRKDNRKLLWNLLMFYLWHEKWNVK